MPKGRVENLKLIKTTEKARELGRKGGIASGKAKRKKKFMASIYAEMLADEYEIQIDEETKANLSGPAFIKYVGTDNELRIVIDDEQERNDKEDRNEVCKTTKENRRQKESLYQGIQEAQ